MSAGNMTGCTVAGLAEVTEYSAFYTVQDYASPKLNLFEPVGL